MDGSASGHGFFLLPVDGIRPLTSVERTVVVVFFSVSMTVTEDVVAGVSVQLCQQ